MPRHQRAAYARPTQSTQSIQQAARNVKSLSNITPHQPSSGPQGNFYRGWGHSPALLLLRKKHLSSSCCTKGAHFPSALIPYVTLTTNLQNFKNWHLSFQGLMTKGLFLTPLDTQMFHAWKDSARNLEVLMAHLHLRNNDGRLLNIVAQWTNRHWVSLFSFLPVPPTNCRASLSNWHTCTLLSLLPLTTYQGCLATVMMLDSQHPQTTSQCQPSI